jgi:hypothetical protein
MSWILPFLSKEVAGKAPTTARGGQGANVMRVVLHYMRCDEPSSQAGSSFAYRTGSSIIILRLLLGGRGTKEAKATNVRQ